MQRIKRGGLIFFVALLSLLFLSMKTLTIMPSSLMLALPFESMAKPPTGYDPLTEQEQLSVLDYALQAEQSSERTASDADKLEVLLVERHEVSKTERATGNWERQGDVYLYDYATDTLIHSTVDVQSGAVVATERLQNVQLPLTEREEERALAVVRAEPALWSTLTERYHAITGEMLDDFSQLRVKVSLFHADSMPDQVNSAAKACGLHRCAQVLIFTVDKTLLEIMPIVDLSQGKVAQLLGEKYVQ